MEKYLELFQKLGLQDPREFYLNCAVANLSCKTGTLHTAGPQAIINGEYRRATGKSTEAMVRAIYYALYSDKDKNIILECASIQRAAQISGSLQRAFERLGTPYRYSLGNHEFEVNGKKLQVIPYHLAGVGIISIFDN